MKLRIDETEVHTAIENYVRAKLQVELTEVEIEVTRSRQPHHCYADITFEVQANS